MADACVKFCYAKKGAYIWSNVQPAFEKRYQLSKTDKFVEAMNTEIRKKKPDFALGNSHAAKYFVDTRKKVTFLGWYYLIAGLGMQFVGNLLDMH